MKDAMRAKDAVRLESIRLLRAAIQRREVDERIDLTDDRPNPIRLEYGVPSRGRVEVAWIVAGSGDVLVRYAADKADDVRATGTLR